MIPACAPRETARLRLATPPRGTPTPPTLRDRVCAWWRRQAPLLRSAAGTWALIVLVAAVLGLSVYVWELRGWVKRNVPRPTPPTAGYARDMAPVVMPDEATRVRAWEAERGDGS